ncbi:MAG: hypothetical protein NC548_31905 [Lachnospiraceae bacterium]|nr:hypothetical protein [Lachnospiraceae bacterium]MCM1230484.1 hypothetical protein [Ruminococcus flavefaciens]
MNDDTILQYLEHIDNYGLPYESSNIMRIITDYDELVQYKKIPQLRYWLNI